MDTEATVPLERRLLKHQMDILAGNMPGIAIGTALLAVGTAIMLVQAEVPKEPVMGWLLGILAFLALRAGIFHRFHRKGITYDNAPRWSVAAVVSAAMAGAAWGALGLLFFDPQDPLRLTILAIVISAMMASATNSLGAYWPANLAFSTLCTSAITFQCLVDDSPKIQTLGVLGILYLAFTSSYARSIARTIRESLQLRFENQALVNGLRDAKERAEVANLSKTRFLAAASHDLRQPIHAMNLCLPVLRRLTPDSAAIAATMGTVTDRIQTSLDSMGKLLHLLLDVSRLDAGALEPKLEPCSVGQCLQTVADQVQSQAESKGLVLRVVDRDHWVLCDAVMLQSMLSNLVHNAVRYTDRGGVLLGTRQRGDRIWIEVWDTGRGVPAEELPKLCEEFFQASNAHRQHSQTRGFGLGLAIVRRMAQLCGGELHIRSHLGRGSRFSIALPMSQAAEPTPTMAAPKAPARSRKLLVVDNDVHILAAIQDLMRSWGHQIIVAQDVDEALTKAVRHADEIELALVDFHLGDQASGVDVALMLRRLLKRELPLVLLTGDTSSEVRQLAEQAGVQVVYKPVKPATLQGIIEGCA
jgi:signal transduction histidine kinase